jgi:hypothetical protein
MAEFKKSKKALALQTIKVKKAQKRLPCQEVIQEGQKRHSLQENLS